MRKIQLDEKSISLEYLENKSLKFLAEKYNVSHETIRRILKKNNINCRKNGGKTRHYEYIDLHDYEQTKYIGVYKKDNLYYAIWKTNKHTYYIIDQSDNINECAEIYNNKIKKTKRTGLAGAFNLITD